MNLTQQKDIEKMLKSSRNRKRVSLDLDEVVFRPKEDSALEKPLPFPFGRIYRERLRKGIPALFQTMKRKDTTYGFTAPGTTPWTTCSTTFCTTL